MTGRGLKTALLPLLNPGAAAAAAAAAAASGAPKLTREAARAAVRNVAMTGMGYFPQPPPRSTPAPPSPEEQEVSQPSHSTQSSSPNVSRPHGSLVDVEEEDDLLDTLGEMEALDVDDEDLDDEDGLLAEDDDEEEGEAIEVTPTTGRAFSLKPKRRMTVSGGSGPRNGSKLRLSGRR